MLNTMRFYTKSITLEYLCKEQKLDLIEVLYCTNCYSPGSWCNLEYIVNIICIKTQYLEYILNLNIEKCPMEPVICGHSVPPVTLVINDRWSLMQVKSCIGASNCGHEYENRSKLWLIIDLKSIHMKAL